ncbi:MAG: GNAT family N-acetyltransferase [Clostridia bacterium]|nr:GNAT family N-acetyltransferase [Clostridia bacterium]
MELIRATEQDVEELLAFYRHVADTMEEKGLQQWHWGRYPNEEMIREDIALGDLYYMLEGNTIAAAVVLMTGQEKEYDSLQWSCGVKPGIFHRLAVHPAMQGAGLGGLVLDDVLQLLRRSGCDCARCDTSEKNRHAIRLYEKLGFRPCGTMKWPDAPGRNIRFDKPLKRETPLWPIPMVPAFRGGELTPWGGSRLRERFGKETEQERTGESLEVSCIAGLESRDALGRNLPELIREFGEKLVGNYADQPFPLLLKLIDARERLSVQVHPNDTYAAAREGGKLGKSEAWLVLDTPPEGGELVYGIRPGTTLQALREACEAGSAVEKLLNRVKVTAGDVCYIPAGCVHSIGEGILLYEIQESSDLTYRFYDWDRTDEHGRCRELHVGKALDVADLRSAPVPLRVEKSFGVKRVLSEDCFTLDLIRTDRIEMLPAVHEFGILTVIEGEMELRFAGGSLRMKAGETCLIPRSSPSLALVGPGAAALAMPG